MPILVTEKNGDWIVWGDDGVAYTLTQEAVRDMIFGGTTLTAWQSWALETIKNELTEKLVINNTVGKNLDRRFESLAIGMIIHGIDYLLAKDEKQCTS